MTYATLLVHLGGGARSRACTDVAIQLARRFESHLDGLATIAAAPVEAIREFEAWVPDPGHGEPARQLRAAEARAERFRQRCESAGVVSFGCTVAPGEEHAALLAHGLCSDLVIVGQPDPALFDHRDAQAGLERVVLRGVAPTLVVPYAGSPAPLGERVLVAWSDSGPTARAIASALPLLRQARQVTLVHCERLAGDSGANRLGQFVRWLERHGVTARPMFERTGIDVGEALLSRSADLGADLVVMGAWSRSRWSERVLGGVTRTMLGSMTAPVLMAH